MNKDSSNLDFGIHSNTSASGFYKCIFKKKEKEITSPMKSSANFLKRNAASASPNKNFSFLANFCFSHKICTIKAKNLGESHLEAQ